MLFATEPVNNFPTPPEPTEIVGEPEIKMLPVVCVVALALAFNINAVEDVSVVVTFCATVKSPVFVATLMVPDAVMPLVVEVVTPSELLTEPMVNPMLFL